MTVAYFCNSAVTSEAICANCDSSVDNIDSSEVLTSFIHEDDKVGTDLLASLLFEVQLFGTSVKLS